MENNSINDTLKALNNIAASYSQQTRWVKRLTIVIAASSLLQAILMLLSYLSHK